MSEFKIVSDYKPSGDQPKAIEDLTKGIISGDKEQTLLGVTGSGKTFTMANVIEKVQKPHYHHFPQQDARRPALPGVQDLLSR